MKNVSGIVTIGKCNGCAACYCMCPNGYIQCKEDSSIGFPVPYVEKCDECGACLKSCPFSDTYEEDNDG